MKSGREHTIINFDGNKLNTATIEDLIFQIEGVKDLQFQTTNDKKIAKILVEIDNPESLDETIQRVNEFTKTDIGNTIRISKKSDFKFSEFNSISIFLFDRLKIVITLFSSLLLIKAKPKLSSLDEIISILPP